MRNIVLILAAVLGVVSVIPYIKNTLSGKTKPNIASWSTWSLLNVIVTVSALASGDATNTVVLGGSFLIGSTTVLLIAIYKGTRQYAKFDIFCQTIAIIGVVLWQLTDNPSIALIFVIGIDIFGVLPTYRHAYLHPKEETWITYLITAISALLILIAAENTSFASLAIPIESILITSTLTGLILYRARKSIAQA